MIVIIRLKTKKLWELVKKHFKRCLFSSRDIATISIILSFKKLGVNCQANVSDYIVDSSCFPKINRVLHSDVSLKQNLGLLDKKLSR